MTFGTHYRDIKCNITYPGAYWHTMYMASASSMSGAMSLEQKVQAQPTLYDFAQTTCNKMQLQKLCFKTSE